LNKVFTQMACLLYTGMDYVPQLGWISILMFMVLILHDRCRVKYVSQSWSQSIYFRIAVPLLLQLLWCNAGPLSRRKGKRVQRFPDKILECEI